MCDGSTSADTLIADLCVCWVWETQTKALLVNRVVDTDTPSHHGRSPCDVLGLAKVDTNICKLVRTNIMPHLLHSVF